LLIIDSFHYKDFLPEKSINFQYILQENLFLSPI
jgi:hypothetical protein